jgi:hypothetical protein
VNTEKLNDVAPSTVVLAGLAASQPNPPVRFPAAS